MAKMYYHDSDNPTQDVPVSKLTPMPVILTDPDDEDNHGLEVRGSVDPKASTPHTFNLTLTDANTEYNQEFPPDCRGFEFQCRTEATIRYAYATGKVAGSTAPYHTLKAGDVKYKEGIAQGASPSTLFFASATAGVVVEIEAWN